MKPNLRQAWENQVLVGDGAMGTYLYQKDFLWAYHMKN